MSFAPWIFLYRSRTLV